MMTSSDRDETKGMIMIPMTSPAASALVGCAARKPSGTKGSALMPVAALRTSGATNCRAKKP